MGMRMLAEGVGFEPTRACALPVFKTGAINHSTTPPEARRRQNCAIAIPWSKADRLDLPTAHFAGKCEDCETAQLRAAKDGTAEFHGVCVRRLRKRQDFRAS